MKREILNLDITLGPLHYHLQAHDSWAAELLGRLPGRIDCRGFSAAADRHIHVVSQTLDHRDAEIFNAGILMPELAAIVTTKLPARNWQISGNDTTYLTWRHNDTSHIFWTRSYRQAKHSLAFHLPLDLLLHDIVQLGGSIVHGGLAVYHDRGVLITAPPGGGKTTAFSTIPDNWQLKSDDASLVWPAANGVFMISPLPTWSVLCGVNSQPKQIVRWQIGSSYPLEMVVFLEKANTLTLTQTKAIAAVFPIYQACSEYPTVIVGRAPYRGKLFNTAASLARKLPCHRLQLPRRGNFWQHLQKELSDERG